MMNTKKSAFNMAAAFCLLGVSAAPALSQGAAKQPAGEGAIRLAVNDNGSSRGARGGIQSVTYAVRLQTLSQTMITRSLLTALEIDQSIQLRRLANARRNFTRLMRALRRGDEGLGLSRPTRPQVVQKLEKLEKEWSVFGSAVDKIVGTGRATKRNVAIVAECIKPLAAATRELIDVYEHFATGGRTFSALTPMVSRAENSRALIKEMTAEYLLIAYGYEKEAYRAKLRQSYAMFDRTLTGLIHGDPGLRLLAAPNRLINDELMQARTNWQTLAAAVDRVLQGGKVSRVRAPIVERQADRLAGRMGRAVTLYKGL